MKHARALPERADDAVTDGEVVLDQPELGDPDLGEVHPVRVREPDDVIADRKLQCGGLRSGHDRDRSRAATRIEIEVDARRADLDPPGITGP
jgi:hypothetical protein